MIDLTPPKPPESDPPREESKIIDIRTQEPLTIQLSDDKPPYCHSQHKSITVDEQTRLVECRECGQVLDPFDYLLKWARKGDQRLGRLRSLDDEIRMKENDLEAVKAALAREKARVRQINPDAPEVVTWKRRLRQLRSGNDYKGT